MQLFIGINIRTETHPGLIEPINCIQTLQHEAKELQSLTGGINKQRRSWTVGAECVSNWSYYTD